MAASEKTLGKLHERLATVLLEMLEPQEVPAVFDDDGNEVRPARVEYPSASVVQAAATFLKHNNITAVIEEDENLKALQDKLAARGRVTDADIKDALNNYRSGRIQ